jgi:acetyltransferase-like isoleucine patch superfamily enzyme
MNEEEFLEIFENVTSFKKNKYHPLVWISGEPRIGKNVHIGGLSEIYAKGATVSIGDDCDIASFVVINCSDSHKKTIGLSPDIERKDIILENNDYVGTQSFIGGGTYIGHHSVVGAATRVPSGVYPPYTLIVGNPAVVKEGYYSKFGGGV